MPAKHGEDLLLADSRRERVYAADQLEDAVLAHERLETALKGDTSPDLIAQFADSYAQLGADGGRSTLGRYRPIGLQPALEDPARSHPSVPGRRSKEDRPCRSAVSPGSGGTEA